MVRHRTAVRPQHQVRVLAIQLNQANPAPAVRTPFTRGNVGGEAAQLFMQPHCRWNTYQRSQLP